LILFIVLPFLALAHILCYPYASILTELHVRVKGEINLATKCELCGKSPSYGQNVSHSKRHTNRRWKINVHAAKLMIEGRQRKLNICTRCLRTSQKLGTNQ
jgi:large subunit ribosomal protein L28